MINLPTGLTRENCRKGVHDIRWHLVDPYLRQCTDSGDLQSLAAHLSIHINTLSARRKYVLKLPPLRTGRPARVTLRQKEVNELLQSGYSIRQASILLERSRQDVASAKRELEKTYADFIASRCVRCAGLGLVAASNKRDRHVCEDCLGTGKSGSTPHVESGTFEEQRKFYRGEDE